VTPGIAITGLRKQFGPTVAVEQLDLVVQPGEFVGLIGHNGAGKSTLLKMLAGQLLPTAGTVQIAGVDMLTAPNQARANLGFVPEEAPLWDYLSAREFLEFVIGVRGKGDLAAALELTGLGSDADRLIREYSQGMRRKTALAAALVAEPSVIVLDEALNGLDPPSAARTKGLLKERCQQGACVLFSTHIVETVEAVADRVVMMARGRVVDDRRVADIPAGGLEQLFLGQIGPIAG
jgi:ABC-2 type transport system ATP-binding protein